MNRTKTGIEHLDDILGGGFPGASVNIIAGPPGTGKTVMVQQIVSSLASADRKVLYLSTVNEPLHKILRYVQGFSFFDPEKVGKSMLYEDIGALLIKAPVEEVLKAVESMVRRENPAVLVIDSFAALTDLAENPSQLRRALYELAGVLSSTGCTTFLVGEYGPEDVLEAPEAAVADGIIQLINERRGLRQYRYLSVVKLRGSGYVDGQHAFRLTEDGVRIFPRFRTPPRPAAYEGGEQRTSTGVKVLDEMLGGGLLQGSTTLLMGSAGTGKTTLGLTVAFAAVQRGEPVTLVTFAEDPSQLEALAGKFGWDSRQAIDQGTLRHLYVSPVELDIDQHVLRIVDAVEQSGSRQVVIDSLSDFESAAYDEARFRHYLFSLIQYFKDRRITAMVTYEQRGDRAFMSAPTGLSRFADNVIALRFADQDGGFVHVLQVSKTRGSEHSYDNREFRITERGLEFSPPRRGPMPEGEPQR